MAAEGITTVASHDSEGITTVASHDSEERNRGSDKLMESSPVPQNHMKLLSHLVMAVCSFICVEPITPSEVTAGLESIMLINYLEKILLLFVRMPDILSPRKTYSTMSRFIGLETYTRTVVMVLKAYALLVVTNVRYIRIAVIPIVIIVFIGAVYSKFRENDSSVHSKKRELDTLQNGTKSIRKVMKMAMVPYLLQLSFVIWTQYNRQQGGIFIFSGVLLFFNSVLGALAVMIATQPVGVSPGVAQVLPVLQRTCIITLLVTTHTMAAEWLGEDIIFACMPELIAVLVWFAVRFDHAGHAVSVNSIRLRRSGLVMLSCSIAAILAYLAKMYANDRNIMASWFRWALCISIASSALSCFHVWMLHQWPGSTTNSNGPIKMLKISTKICLSMTAILCVLFVISVFLLREVSTVSCSIAWDLNAINTAATLLYPVVADIIC